jgi:hypothetical protein
LKLLNEAGLVDKANLKRSDVDLIFTAQKLPGAKTLDYAQFLQALDVVAATVLAHVKEYPGKARGLRSATA